MAIIITATEKDQEAKANIVFSPRGTAELHPTVWDGYRYLTVHFENLEAHRVAYRGTLRFRDVARDGRLETIKDQYGRDYDALYATRVDDFCAGPTSAARRKLVEIISAAVAQWEAEHGERAYLIAGLAAAQETHDKLAAEVKKLEVELVDKRAAKARAAAALKQARMARVKAPVAS